MSARRSKGDPSKGGPQFYEQLYGIDRWSLRYWWPRLQERKLLCAALFAVLLAAPFAGMVAFERLGSAYHAFRADRYYRSARRFLDAGDPASAKIELQNSYRHDPGRIESIRLYAQTLETLCDPGFFPAAFQAWLAEPDDPDSTKRALRAALAADSDEIASELVARVLKGTWRDAGLWLLAARFLLEKGHHAEAYGAAAKARDIDPKSDEARWAVATMAAHGNKPELREEGLAELRALQRQPERHRQASWWLASALARDDPEGAMAVLDGLIDQHEDAWQARLRRIRIEHRVRPEKTPASLDALWGATTNAAVRAATVEMALNLRQTDAAGQLLASLPEDARLRLPFALFQLRVFAAGKEWDKVLELANGASARCAEEAEQAALRPWIYKVHRERKDQSSAAASLRLLLNRCMGRPWAALDAAQRLIRLGLRDEAAQVLGLFADAAGPMGRHFRWRIELLRAGQGRVRAMLEIAEQGLGADANDPRAMNNAAACLLLLGEDPGRALELAQRAVALKPDRPHYRDTEALALAANGRLADALAIYETLPLDRLNQPDFRVNRAFVLMQAGRTEEARRLLVGIDTKALLPEQLRMVAAVQGEGPAAARTEGVSP